MIGIRKMFALAGLGLAVGLAGCSSRDATAAASDDGQATASEAAAPAVESADDPGDATIEPEETS